MPSSVIRLATPLDAAPLQAIYEPHVRESAISFELEVPSVAQMRDRIERTLPRLPWVICENQGKILGYAYAAVHRPRAAYQWAVEVSVYVHAEARRRGVGRAVYASLFRLLAVQRYHNAYAGIVLPNPASVGLHESLGFQPVGIYRRVGFKLGAWRDVGWWQLALREHAIPPEPPVDLGSLRGAPACEAALAAGLPLLRS